MAVTIKHAFTSGIADDGQAAAHGEVLPSHWNADHTVTGLDNITGPVGIGGTANAAAQLDVASTTKGFLPPRMTTAQRNAIATPPAGLMVWNTDTLGINVFDGYAWIQMQQSGSFMLPLDDLGSGVVNLIPSSGIGAATFTRATTAAARLSTGLWNLGVAAGTARSHYLPNLTYGGYLAEGAATQLLLNPRDMTQAAWIAVNMTTVQTSVGLAGAANSCTRLTATAINATILQTKTAAATSRTYSCYIKRITGTGAIGICQDGVTFTDVTAQVNSAGFSLVQLNANQLNAVMGIRLAVSGDAIDVDCNQFEAGAFATTPIPAAGTRAVDFLQYPAASNLNNTQGTLYFEAAAVDAFVAFSATIGDNPSNVTIAADFSGATRPLAYFDGTNSVNGPIVTAISLNQVFKGAVSWSGALGNLFVNGAAILGGSYDGSWGMTNLVMGNGAGQLAMCGTLKNVRIWTSQLPDATLQAMTA